MGRLLMIGEALVDIVESPDGTRTQHPGGSPANVALTAARLGSRAELLTWLGDDELGRTVTDHLAGSGVVVLPQSLGAARTPTARARIDHDGAATYEFDLAWQLAPVDIEDSFAVVHTGSIAAVAATDPPGALGTLLAEAREVATITYDPNLRPTVMGPAGAVRADVEALVAASDVVKVSDEDLAWLHPGEDPAEVVADWVAEHGLALGIVTRGAAGPLALLPGGQRVEVAAPRVAVVDTVGAGDSFMGALIHDLDVRGLTGARNRRRLHAVSVHEATEILAFAAQVAAVTVSRAGANPPSSAEVRGSLT
ncbi:carbohydrate kinase [Georgenia sp. H159]|uniref:carbohydrate kinase family protein n=1 Tax=Georgenia sp. H159 TaxID=3076115 RepID=UPI002D7695D2|nr:carbohydrate kinase [Georgenia sp. H159]